MFGWFKRSLSGRIVKQKQLRNISEVVRGSVFYNCNFTGFDLTRSDFIGCEFESCIFYQTNLNYTIFKRCLIHCCAFTGIDFTTVVFRNNEGRSSFLNCKMNWKSHNLISMILKREAKTHSQMSAANFVDINYNFCWKQFMDADHPEKQWALDTVRKYLLPGETHEYLLAEGS